MIPRYAETGRVLKQAMEDQGVTIDDLLRVYRLPEAAQKTAKQMLVNARGGHAPVRADLRAKTERFLKLPECALDPRQQGRGGGAGSSVRSTRSRAEPRQSRTALPRRSRSMRTEELTLRQLLEGAEVELTLQELATLLEPGDVEERGTKLLELSQFMDQPLPRRLRQEIEEAIARQKAGEREDEEEEPAEDGARGVARGRAEREEEEEDDEGDERGREAARETQQQAAASTATMMETSLSLSDSAIASLPTEGSRQVLVETPTGWVVRLECCVSPDLAKFLQTNHRA